MPASVGRAAVKAASRCAVPPWRFRQDHAMATIQEVKISGETIRLGQLLKLSGIAESGGDGKALLLAEGVRVNGVSETRRGRQLRDGDVVTAGGETVSVVTTAP